jgi:GTP-binding protein lepA
MAVGVREKQAGSIVHWRMLAKPHPGLADPPLFFRRPQLAETGFFG